MPRLFAVPLLALLAHPLQAADVSVQPADGKVRVTIDGELFTEYRYTDCENPFLYPVIGPHGIAMTRNFPMKKVPGEAHDHIHHTSIWFGHDGLNGVDFWRTARDGHGRVVQQTLTDTASGEDVGSLSADNHWVDAGGKIICSDSRTITFRVLPEGRAIDWKVTLKATEGKLTIGDTEEGTMAIRTHPNLRLENQEDEGVTTAVGQAVTSRGVRGKEVWGKRAAWIDYWGKIDGHMVGIALMDNPANPRHPTWYHARPYGLFTANPFGIADFEDKPRGGGDMVIEDGRSVTFRYRILFHEGDPEQAKISAAYKRYAQK